MKKNFNEGNQIHDFIKHILQYEAFIFHLLKHLKIFFLNSFFCILKVSEDFGTDPHQDPLVRGTDPRIRIRIRILPKCHGSGTPLFSTGTEVF
jgi:hypothetical protein